MLFNQLVIAVIVEQNVCDIIAPIRIVFSVKTSILVIYKAKYMVIMGSNLFWNLCRLYFDLIQNMALIMMSAKQGHQPPGIDWLKGVSGKYAPMRFQDNLPSKS